MRQLAANDEVKNVWKYCSVKYKRNSFIFVRFGTEYVIETTYVLCYINHFSPAVSLFLRLNKMGVLCIFTGVSLPSSRFVSNLSETSLSGLVVTTDCNILPVKN
jgi:hypothetical protein